jgi:hypothetical protein
VSLAKSVTELLEIVGADTIIAKMMNKLEIARAMFLNIVVIFLAIIKVIALTF